MTPRTLPGLTAAMEGLRRAAQGSVLVGIQGADAAQDDGVTPPLVVVAAANEFGTEVAGVPRIPPRPFLRTAFDRRRALWGDLAKQAIVRRENDGAVLLDMSRIRILGAVMVGDVQETLRDGPWTPNAPTTKKRSDQPLIDTGRLVQSVRAAYEDEAGTTLL